MNTRSLFLSALIAGAALGVLGNLPVLNLVNCFLCLWVWLGGILAVYLYNRYERNRTQLDQASATPVQGAGAGALAGLVGAFVGVFVYALTSFISTPMLVELARSLNINMFNPGTGIGRAVIFFHFIWSTQIGSYCLIFCLRKPRQVNTACSTWLQKPIVGSSDSIFHLFPA
jgi:hypothetical protein